MLASKNSYIKSAYEQLQIISQDKKKRMEYEMREKAINTRFTNIFYFTGYRLIRGGNKEFTLIRNRKAEYYFGVDTGRKVYERSH